MAKAKRNGFQRYNGHKRYELELSRKRKKRRYDWNLLDGIGTYEVEMNTGINMNDPDAKKQLKKIKVPKGCQLCVYKNGKFYPVNE